MNSKHKMQQGASSIGLFIILAIIGAGIYIGLQYIPQYIERGTVDSILGNLETAHKETPFSNTKSIQDMIGKQLDINQMDDLQESFTVTQDEATYIVKVSYERELNLLYEKKPIKYEKAIVLK